MVPRIALLLGSVLLLAACGTTSSPGTDGGYGPASAAPSPTAPAPSEATTDAPESPAAESPSPSEASPRTGTRIRVADSEFGPMLFATSGQAIYLFDKEEGSRAECYGACAADWPPVLTDGEPQGVRGARPGLLGTTERRDGSLQVTYGGHPLYFYAHEDPWQVLCHDFVEYGGTWFVVQPDGDAAPPGT